MRKAGWIFHIHFVCLCLEATKREHRRAMLMWPCVKLFLFDAGFKVSCHCQSLRWSTFPWMYLLSGIFKDTEMAFISYVCINLFISVNTIMSTSILFFLSEISRHNHEVSMSCQSM